MPTTTQALAATTFQAPSLGLLATEPLRALLDYFSAQVAMAPPVAGDGHPVVVYPGLGTGSMNTAQLRNFIKDCGFTVHDWEGGVNTGPEGVLDDWLGTLDDRIMQLHAQYGRKVSLIGWSLGGVYAREIAKRCPDCVRQVITLGTPFAALAHGNHAGTVFKLLNREKAHLPPELEARLREPPPVPTTSVYSKTDGIVCWQACVEKKSRTTESIEVQASHLGMVTHPEVLGIIANRLSLPEGKWRPLRKRERLG